MVYTMPSSLDSIQDVRQTRMSTEEVRVDWRNICRSKYHEKADYEETMDCVESCPLRDGGANCLCPHSEHLRNNEERAHTDKWYKFNSQKRILEAVGFLLERDEFKADPIFINVKKLFEYNKWADQLIAFRVREITKPMATVLPADTITTEEGSPVPRFEDKIQFLLYRCTMVMNDSNYDEVFNQLHEQVKINLFGHIYLLKQRILEALDEVEVELAKHPEPIPMQGWELYYDQAMLSQSSS